MNSEKYIPSQEEINEAESLMTDEQRRASEIREENYEQKQPPWTDFTKNIDENFLRKKPSPEAIERMDRSLEELGYIFERSDFNWHLDGALNISLMNGAGENPERYIGEHKDVDISVEKKDLKAIEAQLLKRGYGLFLSRTEEKTKNRIVRRVGYSDFSESNAEHITIAAIDENGKILQDKALNFVDVHIIQRDENGNPVGLLGTPLPEKWIQPQPIEFHGKTINLSHPGKVLYYKLHQGRDYDITDIERLIETGKLTEEDIIDVEGVLEDEFKTAQERGREIFEKTAGQIEPDMNAQEIFSVIRRQPEFNEREDVIKELAAKIAETKDRSAENMLTIAMDLFGFKEKNHKKRRDLNKMRQKVKGFQEST